MRAFLRASTMYQHCCYNNDVQMLLLLAAVRILLCVMLFLFVVSHSAAVSGCSFCSLVYCYFCSVLLLVSGSSSYHGNSWVASRCRTYVLRCLYDVVCATFVHYVLCTTFAHICYIRIRPRSEIPPAAAYISCVPRGTTASASCFVVFLSCCISTYRRTHPLIPSL